MMQSSLSARISLGIFLALVAFVGIGHVRSYRSSTPVDFRAFYCAGRVELQHGDPYRAEPLFRCERAIATAEGGAFLTPATVPLPAYDFVPLAALATLPVHVARAVYLLLIVAAMAALASGIARVTTMPPALAFALAFFGAMYEAVGFGQLAPIAIAAVMLAALALRDAKPRAAALWLGLAMLQPQIALPALVALLLFVKGARVTAASVLALLGGLAVASDGLRGIREYPAVLALQARAEVVNPTQYSLTWLLHALGTDARWAITAGSITSIAALVAVFALLSRCRGAAVASGAVVAFPAAIAAFGGTYVHVYQAEVALVAAVVLASRSPIDFWLGVALAALLVPFEPLSDAPGLSSLPAVALALASAWLAICLLSRDVALRTAARRASLASATALGYFVLCAIVRHHLIVPAIAARDIAYEAAGYASAEYLAYAETLAAPSPAQTLFLILLKFPVWLALAIVVWKWSVRLRQPATRDYLTA